MKRPMLRFFCVITGLVVLNGCSWIFGWNDPKYLRTNYYETQGTFIIRAITLFPRMSREADRNEYSIFVQTISHGGPNLTIRVSGLSRETDPQVKVLASLAKIIFPSGELASLTKNDFFLKDSAKCKFGDCYLNGQEFDFPLIPGLKWGEKLARKEDPLVSSFRLVIPVEVKEYIYQEDGMPVFDSSGLRPQFRKRRFDATFVYENRQQPGEPYIDLDWYAAH
jgi:hypothetical protein